MILLTYLLTLEIDLGFFSEIQTIFYELKIFNKNIKRSGFFRIRGLQYLNKKIMCHNIFKLKCKNSLNL